MANMTLQSKRAENWPHSLRKCGLLSQDSLGWCLLDFPILRLQLSFASVKSYHRLLHALVVSYFVAHVPHVAVFVDL